ncbi:unnamed protein product [Mucor circinelloides]
MSTPSDSTTPLSLDDAVRRLVDEVSRLGIDIATAGDKPKEEVDPLRELLRLKTADLESIRGLPGLTSSFTFGASPGLANGGMVAATGSSTVVPTGLPLFQWPGFIRDAKRESFADIEECLRRFEDVLNSHGLDFDSNWLRLLPRCLGHDLRDWLNEFVQVNGSVVSWSFFKDAIVSRYGVPKEQLRFARIREFLNCVKLETESVDAFLERFKSLKVRSEVSDKYVIAKVFFDAFPESTSRLIMVAMGQASESSFYDVDFVSSVARRLDIAVDKKLGKVASGLSGAPKKRDAESSNLVISGEAKKSKYSSVAGGDSGSRGHGRFSGAYDGNQKGKFVSKFGKTMAEHIAERTCKDCNGHYGKGHAGNCGTAIRSGSGGSKVVRMMRKRQNVQSMVDAALASELGNRVLQEKKGVSSSSVSSAGFSAVAEPAKVMTGSSSSPVAVPAAVFTVDTDIEMSESDDHSVEDEADLKMKVQASSLVDGMSSVCVNDAELLLNMTAQE